MLRLLASVTVYCFRGGTFSENFKLVRESGLTTRLARKTRFKWRAHWQKVFAALPVLPLFSFSSPSLPKGSKILKILDLSS